MPTAVSTYLTFANPQMAAEAIYPVGFTSGPIPVSTLTTGNNRTNRFTPTQAEQFAREWEVVDHKPNTGTGFSGTLCASRPRTAAAHGSRYSRLVRVA